MHPKIKKRYLILSDLDGTLLNNKSELDKLTIDVINELIRKGHVFCILTGRPPETSLWIYEQLGLKHLLSNRNGAYIWHPNNPKFNALNFSFSFDVIEKILKQKIIKKSARNIVILNNKGAFVSHFPSTANEKEWYYQNLHIRDDGHLFKINPDFSNVKGIDVQTVILMLSNTSNLDDIMYLFHLHSQTLTARFWRESRNGLVIEINSQFACKGKSIEFISNYYGITLNHCISFGDGDNDVEMLTTAWHSFAMKNATRTAKIYARYITEYDNDNCGVARELIKFFKLKGYNNK